MAQELKFIGLFAVATLVAVFLLGVSSFFGALVFSCLATVVIAFISGRGKSQGEKWRSLAICAGVSTAFLALALTARLYWQLLAIGITGSPYDAPPINLLRVFLLSWFTAFVGSATVLAIFDRQFSAPRPAQDEPFDE